MYNREIIEIDNETLSESRDVPYARESINPSQVLSMMILDTAMRSIFVKSAF